MKTFLLRREYFGGTLFSVSSGKRVHISTDESQSIERSGIVTGQLAEDMGGAGETKMIYPSLLPESGFSSPDTIFLEVTRACNLSCRHCFNDSGRKMDEEMGFEKQKDIIRECAESGVQEIRFTGGEAMVFDRVYDLVQEASRNNLRVSMGTNGTLITQESAEKLSACGLNMAIVSIDGMEKSHDAIRGKGSFQRSINGIKNLCQQGVDVRVNIVAMKPNIEDIPHVVEYFHKRGVSIFVRRFIPLGRSVDIASDFSLTAHDYAWLRSRMKTYLDNPDGFVRGHYLSDNSVKNRVTLPFVRRDCSAGQRALVIDPRGRIQLCGFMDQKSTGFYGSILDESLDRIWQRVIAENPAADLAKVLEAYNNSGIGMKTNCLAIALAVQGSHEGRCLD